MRRQSFGLTLSVPLMDDRENPMQNDQMKFCSARSSMDEQNLGRQVKALDVVAARRKSSSGMASPFAIDRSTT